MEKHFTTLETDFTLETLLPWRKETFQILTMKKWHNLGEEAHASVASGKKAGCIEAEET